MLPISGKLLSCTYVQVHAWRLLLGDLDINKGHDASSGVRVSPILG